MSKLLASIDAKGEPSSGGCRGHRAAGEFRWPFSGNSAVRPWRVLLAAHGDFDVVADRQGAQPEDEPETWPAPSGKALATRPPRALEQQMRPEGMERGQHVGARIARPRDQRVEAEFGHGRHQQAEPSVVTRKGAPHRPLARRPGRDCLDTRHGSAPRPPPEPLDALGGKDRLHRLGRDRRPLGPPASWRCR